jgi:hypothetical protein
MAFDESLAARIRDALARKKGVEEKKMFGGIGFLLNGNMLVGVWKESLIVRLGPEAAPAQSALPQAENPPDYPTGQASPAGDLVKGTPAWCQARISASGKGLTSKRTVTKKSCARKWKSALPVRLPGRQPPAVQMQWSAD